MNQEQDTTQIEQLKSELKAAKQDRISKLQARNFRLLKLTLIMIILAIIAAFVHGRIHI